MAESNQDPKAIVLGRLTTAFEREGPRAVETAGVTYSDDTGGNWKALLERAIRSFEANQMGYHLLADRDELLDSLANNIYSRKVSQVAVGADDLLARLDVTEGLRRRLPRVELLDADELDAEQLAACGVAVTGAEAILAATGTIVCSGVTRTQLLPSLLPRTHLCVAPADRIFVDLGAWLAGTARQPEKNYMFISGPSRTADIEKKVVLGVHGPWKLSTFLLRQTEDGDGP